MAGGFRIKVDLTQLPGSDRRISWFFVGGDCTDVGQLKAAIFTRFQLPTDDLSVVELWLDDCVIPDCEPISLLKSNDYVALRSVPAPFKQAEPNELPVAETPKDNSAESAAEPPETTIVISNVLTITDDFEDDDGKPSETVEAPEIETVELGDDPLLERNENGQQSVAREENGFVTDDVVIPADRKGAADLEEQTEVVVDVKAETSAAAGDDVWGGGHNNNDDSTGFEPQDEYYVMSSVETIDDASCGDSNSGEAAAVKTEQDFAEKVRVEKTCFEQLYEQQLQKSVPGDVLETVSDDNDDATPVAGEPKTDEPTTVLDDDAAAAERARRNRSQSNYWLRRRDFIKKMQETTGPDKPEPTEVEVSSAEATIGIEVAESRAEAETDGKAKAETDVVQIVSSESDESNVPAEMVSKLVEIVALQEQQQDSNLETTKADLKNQEVQEQSIPDVVMVAKTTEEDSDDDIIEVIVIRKSVPVESVAFEPVIANTIENILLADNVDRVTEPPVIIKKEAASMVTVSTNTGTKPSVSTSSVSQAPVQIQTKIDSTIVAEVQKMSKRKRTRLQRAANQAAAAAVAAQQPATQMVTNSQWASFGLDSLKSYRPVAAASTMTTSQSSGNPITVLSRRGVNSPLTSTAAMRLFGTVISPQMDVHYPLFQVHPPPGTLMPLPTPQFHQPPRVPQPVIGPYLVRYPLSPFAMVRHQQQPLASVVPFSFKPEAAEHHQASFVRTTFHVTPPRPVPPPPAPVSVPVPVPAPVPVKAPVLVKAPAPVKVPAPVPAPDSYADSDKGGFWLSSDMIEHRTIPVRVTKVASSSSSVGSAAAGQLGAAAKRTYSYTPAGWCRRSPSKVTAPVLTATAPAPVPAPGPVPLMSRTIKKATVSAAVAAAAKAREVKRNPSASASDSKRSSTTANRTGSGVKRKSPPAEYPERRKITSTGSGTRRKSPSRDASTRRASPSRDTSTKRKSPPRCRSTSADRRKASPAARRRRTPVPSRTQVSPSMRRRQDEAKRRIAQNRISRSQRSSSDSRSGRARRNRSRSRSRSAGERRRQPSTSSSDRSGKRHNRSPPQPAPVRARRSRTISISSITDEETGGDAKRNLDSWSRRITLGSSAATHNRVSPSLAVVIDTHRRRHRSQLDSISSSSSGNGNQESTSFRTGRTGLDPLTVSSQQTNVSKGFRRARLDSISSTSTLNATDRAGDYGPLDSISSKSDLEFEGGEGYRHREHYHSYSPLPQLDQEFEFDEAASPAMSLLGETESGFHWYDYEEDDGGMSSDVMYGYDDDYGLEHVRYYSPDDSGRERQSEYYAEDGLSTDRGYALEDSSPPYMLMPPPRDEYAIGDGGYPEDNSYPMDEYYDESARYEVIDDSEVMFTESYGPVSEGRRSWDRGAELAPQPFANNEPFVPGAGPTRGSLNVSRGPSMRGRGTEGPKQNRQAEQASRGRFSSVGRPPNADKVPAATANIKGRRKKNNLRSILRYEAYMNRKRGIDSATASGGSVSKLDKQQQPLKSILKTAKDSGLAVTTADRNKRTAAKSTGGSTDTNKSNYQENIESAARAYAAAGGYRPAKDSRTATTSSHKLDDYSSYPILEGPPRVNDIIAYKEFETDESGAIIDTEYKVGKVLEYDAYHKEVLLEFPVDLTGKSSGHKSDTEEFREEVAMDMTGFAEVRLISQTHQ